jgi:hypothetical protein
MITISIHKGREPWLTLDVDPIITVSSLKSLISKIGGTSASHSRLVFRGVILSNEMSLFYYQITDGSRVYYVPVAARSAPHSLPYRLLNKLWPLLDKLPNVDSRGYADVISQIRLILADPGIEALSRIDTTVKDAIDDAWTLISTTPRPVSRRTRAILARGQDLQLDQFDSSPDGMRILQSALAECSDDGEIGAPPVVEPMRVRPSLRPSDRPLPNPWSDRKRDRPLYASGLRLSFGNSPGFEFSRELEMLKEMGFSDEGRILQALSEAKGNVLLAAQLLERGVC